MKVLRPIHQFISAEHVAKFDKYVVELAFPDMPKKTYWLKENQMKALMRAMQVKDVRTLPAYTTKTVIAWAAIDVKEDGKEFFVWASDHDTAWMEKTFGPFATPADAAADNAA